MKAFLRGADLSSLPEAEACGARFFDRDGREGDALRILALSGDVEGETTSFYIYRKIEKLASKISTLARGLGFGDDLEYADSLTLGRSIVNRQAFKPQ